MESLNTQTTLLVLSFYHPLALINSLAECKTDPDDPPTNNPSFWTRFLALMNDSWSPVFTQWSINVLSHVYGTKSYPMPSTLLIGNFPSFIVWGIAKILPNGSAATKNVCGDFYFIFLATPVIVPPVPVPITTASSFPSHW